MVLLRLLSIATLALLLLHSTITGATEVDLLVVARSQQDAASSASSAATADDPLSTLQIKRYLNVDPIQYFAISVSFSTPEGGALDTCNEEEQMLMGRDINLLLLDYGIGDLGDDTDPSYMAGICPMPQSIRGSSRALMGWGYVWKGGGGCRFCSRENRDAEPKPGGTIPPDPTPVQRLASELEIALKNVLLPNHPSCLSNTTTVEVSFDEVAYSEIDVYCGKNQIPVLDTIEPERGSTNACGLCLKLDFSTKGDGETKFKEQGAFLKKNEYRKKSPYGVRIWTFAKDSRTRGDARIFDTAGPGVASYPRLGSPNVRCGGDGIGPGGDGIGPGGEPEQPGENCQAMGSKLYHKSSYSITCQRMPNKYR
jgi:hypothetical protein